MPRTLYVDCFSGAAGDMTLGALIDLGVPEQHLRAQLATLDLPGWHLHVGRGARHGIVGVDVQVHVDPDHDHDHADHDHEHHDHSHGRTWREIRPLIEGSGLDPSARDLALRIFERLAVAEARLHGVTPDEVHFHEVGAVDAIVDICGAAVGLTWLAIDEVISAPLPAPRGFVRCAHGRMPLPAPATLELLKGAAIQETEGAGELVTPTGAAIITTVATGYGPLPTMEVEAIGYGVGDKDFEERPNLLRLVLGRTAGHHAPDVVIEANIDDMSGELFGHVTETLFAAGAVDVWLTPIQMKKGRPGTCVSALAPASSHATVLAALLRESTSIGARVTPVQRHKLARRVETVRTAYGEIRVKLALEGDRVVNAAPEFEDCRQAAATAGAPLKDVMRAAEAAIDARWPGKT